MKRMMALALIIGFCSVPRETGAGESTRRPAPAQTASGPRQRVEPAGLVASPVGQRGRLRINSPADKTNVPWRPFVEGKVSAPRATVWVIVHPMEVSDYYVQPAVSVRKNGRWSVQIYIGREGGVDAGKRFEIMAVANPQETLAEGKILHGWPKARLKSQVIEVIRVE